MLAVIVEDITAKKEGEQSLAATRAELARVSRFTIMGELVASIAHEVNQPLAAVITNSDAALRWLALEKPNYEEVVAALRRVSRDANLAGGVIARIRKFLRAGEIKQEWIAVPKLLDELLLMLHTVLQDAGVQVVVRIEPDFPKIFADNVQLQQVILNLIVNAVDAMRERPGPRLLTLEVKEYAADGAIFSVQDCGVGIPPQAQEKLFDAFFSTKQDGLGMGLAISRTIVENHGGRLWLDTSVESGARFVFNIPSI